MKTVNINGFILPVQNSDVHLKAYGTIKSAKKLKNVTKASVIDQFLPNIPNYGRRRGRSCKWEHLKETIFKRKTLFSIVKEETRLKRVIRG